MAFGQPVIRRGVQDRRWQLCRSGGRMVTERPPRSWEPPRLRVTPPLRVTLILRMTSHDIEDVSFPL